MERLPEEESDAYFRSRPRGSRIGAHVSAQSSPLHGGRAALERRAAELQQAREVMLRGGVVNFCSRVCGSNGARRAVLPCHRAASGPHLSISNPVHFFFGSVLSLG